MENNINSPKIQKMKIKNLKKPKTQIIPINRTLFRPISKKNIKNMDEKVKNENRKETTIKQVLNTSSKLEIKNKRLVTPIKGRLSHHIIDCRTPNRKINHKKMDLSINNIIGNVYNNNNYNFKGIRKYNFEKIRNKTPILHSQHSSKAYFGSHKINLGEHNQNVLYSENHLKIIKSLKNELMLKNEENNKLKSELNLLLNNNNNLDNKLNKNDSNEEINKNYLLEKINQLEEENKQLKSIELQFNGFKKENEFLKDKINELNKNINNNIISKLEEENKNLKNEISKLKNIEQEKNLLENKIKNMEQLFKDNNNSEKNKHYKIQNLNKITILSNNKEEKKDNNDNLENEAKAFVNDTFQSIFNIKKMNI